MPRVPLNMPKMSMTMEFGTIVEWLVGPGDKISNGDAVVVVTTDKVDMEVEATFDGVVEEIVAGEGAQLPVGEPMATCRPRPPTAGDCSRTVPGGGETEHERPNGAAPRGAATRLRVSPHVTSVEPSGSPAGPADRLGGGRRSAYGDVRARRGTNPGQAVREAITRRDRAAKAAPAASASTGPAVPVAPMPAAPVPAQTGELLGDDKLRRMRVATANVMNASAAIPQFTVFRALNLGRLARARETSLKGISWTSILVRAYALVLREMPQLNGYWVGSGVQRNDRVGVSLAVDTPQGLLAPVIADPDRITLRQLDRAVRELAETIKGGQIDPNLFAGGTGTVSNLGGMGVDRFNALLTPPQATALSLGAVGRRPVVDADGELGVQIACEAGLTVDYRAADGADGARALDLMQTLLQDPVLLLA